MAITKIQVRARLKSAKNAAERLEADVKWLVSNRAWETLGYANFSEMWEKENGFPSHIFVKVLAVSVMVDEGMNTAKTKQRRLANGHFKIDISNAIGFQTAPHGAVNHSCAVIIDQLLSGIPAEEITSNPQAWREVTSSQAMEQARSQPRRMGKLPNELINAGWSVYKYQADAVKEIARKAGVPDSVVVRSALDMYLNRNQKDVG